MKPPRLPYGDEVYVRHVDLWARALGARKAAAALTIAKSQVSACQAWVDWAEGRARIRLANPGNHGHGKLDLHQARVIRCLRAEGQSTVKLGRRFGVQPQTISKVCRQVLYPEPVSP